jgi:hypothetical protein
MRSGETGQAVRHPMGSTNQLCGDESLHTIQYDLQYLRFGDNANLLSTYAFMYLFISFIICLGCATNSRSQ